MKKYIIGIILVICVIGLILIINPIQKNQEEIRIGAILPLSGDAALAGLNTKEGIDLAVEHINLNDGINGKKIKVIYEDTQADSKMGVSAVNKLITVDKVDYIIDNSISSVTLAVAPVCEKNEVVLLATGATAPSISDAGDYIFRIWNSDAFEGEEIAKFASNQLNLKKVGILYVNNDYGNGLKEVFKNISNNYNLDVLITEAFSPDETDFRSNLTKLLEKAPDAIYLVGYSKECITIIQQAKELGYRGIWLGTTVMLDPTVQNIIERTNYQLYYPVPFAPDPSDSNIKTFREQFLEKYEKDPPALADVGYDAVVLLKKALDNINNSTGKTLKNELYKIEYSGASGLIKFDENGDVHKPIEIKSIK